VTLELASIRPDEPSRLHGAIAQLVSDVRREGRPVVRLRCSDFGDHWAVECDVYSVNELSVEPRSAGPYVFGTAAEARAFVEQSLLMLDVFGCGVG
jgi:hypothetical protein